MRIVVRILIIAMIISIILFSGCVMNTMNEKSNFTVTLAPRSVGVKYNFPVIGTLNPLWAKFYVDVTVRNDQNIPKRNVILTINPVPDTFCNLEQKQETLGSFHPKESKNFSFPLGEGPMNCQISLNYNISSH
jgi:hypothetical protein